MIVCYSEVFVFKIVLVILMCMWINIMFCIFFKIIYYKIFKLIDKFFKEGEKNCYNNLLLNILEKKFVLKIFFF